jgi:phage anti-repressor protein
MLNIIEQDGKKYVELSELYEKLELKKSGYSKFIKNYLKESRFATNGIEFSYLGTKTSDKGGRPKQDYLLTLEFSKDIIIRTNSPVGADYRNWLIGLEKKVENQELWNAKQIAVGYKLLDFFKFTENQLIAEDLHKQHFKSTDFKLSNPFKEHIDKVFYNHRNQLLQIDNSKLKQSLLEAFNQGLIHKASAKNIRTRIFLLDKYQLIRNAVADYLISKGTNTHDAINFADTLKEIAQFTNVEIRIKNEDELFYNKETLTPINNLLN